MSTVAHVCRDKTKGPPLHFCPILFIEARGEWGRAQRAGACPKAPASVFTHAFSPRRAIRLRGGGTQAHINPLPSGCNHHRDAHYALSSMYNIKSPTQRFFTRVSGERQAIRRGGGGKMAHITPSPQAVITIETPITRAPANKTYIYISIRSPVLAGSPQLRPPPSTRASRSLPTFLCSLITWYLHEVPLQSTLLTAHT